MFVSIPLKNICIFHDPKKKKENRIHKCRINTISFLPCIRVSSLSNKILHFLRASNLETKKKKLYVTRRVAELYDVE